MVAEYSRRLATGFEWADGSQLLAASRLDVWQTPGLRAWCLGPHILFPLLMTSQLPAGVSLRTLRGLFSPGFSRSLESLRSCTP